MSTQLKSNLFEPSSENIFGSDTVPDDVLGSDLIQDEFTSAELVLDDILGSEPGDYDHAEAAKTDEANNQLVCLSPTTSASSKDASTRPSTGSSFEQFETSVDGLRIIEWDEALTEEGCIIQVKVPEVVKISFNDSSCSRQNGRIYSVANAMKQNFGRAPTPSVQTAASVIFRPHAWDNDYRTIHLGNLPVNTIYADFLPLIRGGAVFSAILCDTIPITGSMSALITFVESISAATFVELAKSNALIINGAVITATLINTSTYPIDNKTIQNIQTRGHTRCLVVDNYSIEDVSLDTLTSIILNEPQDRFHQIESMTMEYEHTLKIVFTNIKIAGRAFTYLTTLIGFEHLKVIFTEDAYIYSKLDSKQYSTGNGCSDSPL